MGSNPRILPVLALLTGATLWGIAWYPLRLLESGGLSGVWLTVVIYGAALVASLPSALIMISAGWTNIAFVLAVLEGNVLRVLLLFYLSPLWAVLLGWLWLREQPSRRAFVSLALAFGGALVMLWHPKLKIPWPQDAIDWLALSAGVAFAVANVAARKAVRLSVAAKSVAVWLGVIVLGAVLILVGVTPLPVAPVPIFLGALAVGAFGILFMTWVLQYGVTHLPVQRSAVILLFELVAGAASQQLLSEEIVAAREWLGGALIVAGAWLAARTGPGQPE
jgi:drug/metabolite transporter (DMT)-like permease